MYEHRIKMWLFLLVGLLFHIFTATQKITISTESQLLKWLCHPPQLLGNHWLQLTASSYDLSKESEFCVIENVTSLTVQGVTGGSSLQCMISGESAIGFGFINVTNLAILDINVLGCGSTVTSEAVRIFNDSHPHLGVGQKAVFVLNHCTNVTLVNVKVQNGYLGYGFMILNVRGTLSARTIETYIAGLAYACDNSDTFECAGSGIIIVFKDTVVTKAEESAKVDVFDVNLLTGINKIYNIPNLWDISSEDMCKLPLIGAAGLTLVFAQSYQTSLSIIGTKNNMNIGTIGGSMLILFLNGMSNSQVYITSADVSQGYIMPDLTNQVTGSGIVMYSFMCNYYTYATKQNSLTIIPLHLQHVNMTDILLSSSVNNLFGIHTYGGCLLIKINQIWYHSKKMNIIVQNTYFKTYFAATSGSNVYAVIPIDISKYISIVFEDTKVWNSLTDMTLRTIYSCGASFTFVNWNNITIQGTSFFHNNYATVIAAYNTILHLKGQVSIENSVGKVGGAISLHKSSYLVLHEPLNASFTMNHAYLYGGAIYAINDNVYGDNKCAIQVKPNSKTSTKKLNINLAFIKNTAEIAGNSIYANPIYNCSYLYTSAKCSNETTSTYTVMDRINILYADPQGSNGLHYISSNPVKICMCKPQHTYSCSNHKYINVFPGEILLLHLVAVDGGNNIVYSPATATLTNITNQ